MIPKSKKLVDEWKKTFKKISEKDDISEVFRSVYQAYKNNRAVIEIMDEIYGTGSIPFVGKAMEYNDFNCN